MYSNDLDSCQVQLTKYNCNSERSCLNVGLRDYIDRIIFHVERACRFWKTK